MKSYPRGHLGPGRFADITTSRECNLIAARRRLYIKVRLKKDPRVNAIFVPSGLHVGELLSSVLFVSTASIAAVDINHGNLSCEVNVTNEAICYHPATMKSCHYLADHWSLH